MSSKSELQSPLVESLRSHTMQLIKGSIILLAALCYSDGKLDRVGELLLFCLFMALSFEQGAKAEQAHAWNPVKVYFDGIPILFVGWLLLCLFCLGLVKWCLSINGGPMPQYLNTCITGLGLYAGSAIVIHYGRSV